MSQTSLTLIFSGIFLALFATGELLYSKAGFPAETTRKMVHASGGIIALFFPFSFQTHWPVLILCIAFAGVLFLSLKFNFLQSIHAVNRNTWGSFAFPVAIYGSFLAYIITGKQIFFYEPVLVLALADPAAALIGKRWPLGRYRVGGENKSLAGSVAFFMVSFLVCTLLLLKSGDLQTRSWSVVFASALATTLSEAFSGKGLDNISIPLSAIAVLYLFLAV